MSVAAQLTPDQSQQTIYDFLRSAYGLPDQISKIITAQTGHETAGWTSNVYISDNNVAGYGYSGNGNYFSYNSIEDSLSDLVNWLSNHIPDFQDITDETTYAQALHDNGYYTDSVDNYSAGITRWFNSNLQYIVGGSAALLVVGALVLYLLLKKG